MRLVATFACQLTEVYRKGTEFPLTALSAQEAGAAAVDNIWSLQYMAPGALCGAAGPLIQLPTGGTQQQQQPAGVALPQPGAQD